MMKQSMYKATGNGNLHWHELEEVILDVETTMNNRPLGYIEDDVQLPVLTPSLMLYGQPNQIPEEEPMSIEDVNLRKRARYIRRCKTILWTRWETEYHKALTERKQSTFISKIQSVLSVLSVVFFINIYQLTFVFGSILLLGNKTTRITTDSCQNELQNSVG